MPAVFKRRQFLNTEEDGGGAFLNCYVNEAKSNNVSAQFIISDCSRQITLDFEVYGGREGADAERVANVKQKIAKLRKAVVAFEAALLAQLAYVEESD